MKNSDVNKASITKLDWRILIESERDSNVIIDCFNKTSSLPSSIIQLMEDISRLAQNQNIYKCCHIYREANRSFRSILSPKKNNLLPWPSVPLNNKARNL